MQYKGEDMDLRVPHGRAPREIYTPDYEPATSNGRWSRSQSFTVANGEPLWVDEVLLACCNYAFDVAQANGAAEVALERVFLGIDTFGVTVNGVGFHPALSLEFLEIEFFTIIRG